MSKRHEACEELETVGETADRKLTDAELDQVSGGFVIYGAPAETTRGGGTNVVFGDGSVRLAKTDESAA